MNIIGIILLVIGILTTICGGCKFVIEAFEESAWWGIGVLVFPILSPVFLILRFGVAWPHALTFTIGFCITILGVFLRSVAGA